MTEVSAPQKKRRVGLRRELLLALVPTVVVLLVLAFVEVLTESGCCSRRSRRARS